MTIPLQASIATIFDLQHEHSMILTGLYLEPHAIDEIAGLLTRDDPNVGAFGRYDNVPVFRAVDLQRQPLREPVSIAEHNGIIYSFVQMGVVD